MRIAWPVQFHTQQAGYIHFWVTLLQGTCSTSSNDAIITPCIVRVLGVTLDRRLTFDYHASAVARSCNYHARAIRHIRHLLTLDLAQTLACSLILSRIDYCNSVLHGAPSSIIQNLQRVQNNAARIVLQAPPRLDVNSLLQTLHWLPVEQRINYKLAVLTFKTQQTSSPQYLSQHISLRTSARNTRSSSVPLLCVPFRRTSFARRSFSTAAPLTWNSLLPVVLNCNSLYFQIQT